jgi:hypothetical protein
MVQSAAGGGIVTSMLVVAEVLRPLSVAVSQAVLVSGTGEGIESLRPPTSVVARKRTTAAEPAGNVPSHVIARAVGL